MLMLMRDGGISNPLSRIIHRLEARARTHVGRRERRRLVTVL